MNLSQDRGTKILFSGEKRGGDGAGFVFRYPFAGERDII